MLPALRVIVAMNLKNHITSSRVANFCRKGTKTPKLLV